MPVATLDQPPAPLRPWDYLRLRRQASGRTIAQAALCCRRHLTGMEEAERALRTFETPHHVIRRAGLLRLLGAAYRFDLHVYRALRDLPPHQHPTVCRGCGASAWDMPVTADGSEATIGANLICTACDERRVGAIRRAA